jgi:hypothetical protein
MKTGEYHSDFKAMVTAQGMVELPHLERQQLLNQ